MNLADILPASGDGDQIWRTWYTGDESWKHAMLDAALDELRKNVKEGVPQPNLCGAQSEI